MTLAVGGTLNPNQPTNFHGEVSGTMLQFQISYGNRIKTARSPQTVHYIRVHCIPYIHTLTRTFEQLCSISNFTFYNTVSVFERLVVQTAVITIWSTLLEKDTRPINYASFRNEVSMPIMKCFWGPFPDLSGLHIYL